MIENDGKNGEENNPKKKNNFFFFAFFSFPFVNLRSFITGLWEYLSIHFLFFYSAMYIQ